MLADNSNTLINLTYSSELESQAGSSGIPEILSTHPLTAERIQAAKAAAREQTSIKDQSDLQNKWLRLGIN
ncbi:hypothetical protein [Dyadobacter luticola]|uniref:Peptidase M48 domain-containing protein n=1 Tax=Dyadobacter luticola TaxID=1979387 RepID=A0A5R9KWM4_9BACT|nr:hypothetical protein [Dyadobacter luticola]TLV00702.1 hypothetical protein FEN17_14560 [Dyadobacter luticola]